MDAAERGKTYGEHHPLKGWIGQARMLRRFLWVQGMQLFERVIPIIGEGALLSVSRAGSSVASTSKIGAVQLLVPIRRTSTHVSRQGGSTTYSQLETDVMLVSKALILTAVSTLKAELAMPVRDQSVCNVRSVHGLT